MSPSSPCNDLEHRVTIVLATYNRPDALCVAIRSVLRQTYTNWVLMVIGDQCDQRTEDVVSSFQDERIIYFNLPTRFGEQAGPNSVGMALADTSYTALLNHDDIFLPDHLERAVETLESSGADLYLGRAAVARESVDTKTGGRRPIFTSANPVRRPPHYLFHRHNGAVEPVSSWVFRSTLSRRVGLWNSHRCMVRLPPQEWILRAWRAGFRFVSGEEITVLGLATQYQYLSKGGTYYLESAEHRYLDLLMDNTSVESVRSQVRKDLGSGGDSQKLTRVYGAESVLGRLIVKLAANPLTALAYRMTGFDACSAILPWAGAGKGTAMAHLFRLRTGADAPPIKDYQALLNQTIEDQLSSRQSQNA